MRRVEDLQTLLQTPSVDAIEIHTLPGHLEKFKELWDSIGEQAGAWQGCAVASHSQVHLLVTGQLGRSHSLGFSESSRCLYLGWDVPPVDLPLTLSSVEAGSVAVGCCFLEQLQAC